MCIVVVVVIPSGFSPACGCQVQSFHSVPQFYWLTMGQPKLKKVWAWILDVLHVAHPPGQGHEKSDLMRASGRLKMWTWKIILQEEKFLKLKFCLLRSSTGRLCILWLSMSSTPWSSPPSVRKSTWCESRQKCWLVLDLPLASSRCRGLRSS